MLLQTLLRGLPGVGDRLTVGKPPPEKCSRECSRGCCPKFPKDTAVLEILRRSNLYCHYSLFVERFPVNFPQEKKVFQRPCRRVCIYTTVAVFCYITVVGITMIFNIFSMWQDPRVGVLRRALAKVLFLLFFFMETSNNTLTSIPQSTPNF